MDLRNKNSLPGHCGTVVHGISGSDGMGEEDGSKEYRFLGNWGLLIVPPHPHCPYKVPQGSQFVVLQWTMASGFLWIPQRWNDRCLSGTFPTARFRSGTPDYGHPRGGSY